MKAMAGNVLSEHRGADAIDRRVKRSLEYAYGTTRERCHVVLESAMRDITDIGDLS
jgi:hypothetical protein